MMYQNGLTGYNYGNYYSQQPPRQNFDQSRTGMGMPMQNTGQSTYYLKGRPVTSFKEVEASMVDFDGSVFYFLDPANQCIYTKRINEDGTPAYGVYRFQELPIGQPTVIDESNFITRQEFDNAITQLRESLSIAQQPSMVQTTETAVNPNTNSNSNVSTSVGTNNVPQRQVPVNNF